MAAVHVVIGIILNSATEVLIAQRLPHQEKGGAWEFPGGKVETHESALQALRRELKEEVGVDVINAHAWMTVEYQYPHKTVLLDTWWISEFAGEPKGMEGQAICWARAKDLKEREFPEGNRPIIEKLLPLMEA